MSSYGIWGARILVALGLAVTAFGVQDASGATLGDQNTEVSFLGALAGQPGIEGATHAPPNDDEPR